MSYDVYIGESWINHTFNGCEACNEIISVTPKNFDGMIAKDVNLLALKVFNELNDKGELYAHYMPGNGWGTISSWKRFMKDIIKACEEYPDEIVKVSY